MTYFGRCPAKKASLPIIGSRLAGTTWCMLVFWERERARERGTHRRTCRRVCREVGSERERKSCPQSWISGGWSHMARSGGHSWRVSVVDKNGGWTTRLKGEITWVLIWCINRISTHKGSKNINLGNLNKKLKVK